MGTYRKILLKLSGELLATTEAGGLERVGAGLLDDLVEVHRSGVEVAVVVGGGNLFRGARTPEHGITDRASADTIGMLATVMNGLVLASVLEQRGVRTRVLSALRIGTAVEPFSRRLAGECFAGKTVVLLVGGTGHPFLTTDTAAALRAAELGSEVVLKATKVDGVYSADPAVDPKARRYDRMSYTEVLAHRLGVMDAAAVSICRDTGIPIIVFDGTKRGALKAIVEGAPVGTFVGGEDPHG